MKPVPGGYRLEDQVGFHLRRAGQRHAAIFSAHMGEELTPTRWAALVKLSEHGALSQNLLGRETASHLRDRPAPAPGPPERTAGVAFPAC